MGIIEASRRKAGSANRAPSLDNPHEKLLQKHHIFSGNRLDRRLPFPEKSGERTTKILIPYKQCRLKEHSFTKKR